MYSAVNLLLSSMTAPRTTDDAGSNKKAIINRKKGSTASQSLLSHTGRLRTAGHDSLATSVIGCTWLTPDILLYSSIGTSLSVVILVGQETKDSGRCAPQRPESGNARRSTARAQ